MSCAQGAPDRASKGKTWPADYCVWQESGSPRRWLPIAGAGATQGRGELLVLSQLTTTLTLTLGGPGTLTGAISADGEFLILIDLNTGEMPRFGGGLRSFIAFNP